MISFDISITVEEKQFRFAADLLSDTTAILGKTVPENRRLSKPLPD